MTTKLLLAAAFALAATLPLSPARAYTCDEHYSACIGYGHGPVKCSCARKVCRSAVGNTGDAGPKWNHIAGINACFAK